jgi:hypothetical protein
LITRLFTDRPTWWLTQNVDSGPAFTAAAAGAIFNALPFVTALGLLNNTLNVGDVLTDTIGDGTLNDVTAPQIGAGANPPYTTDVMLTGIKTLNITATGFVAGGFQGNVTGLTIVNDTGSTGTVFLGFTGQGLNTALTNINLSGYGGGNGTTAISVVLAAAAGSAANTIAIATTGVLGASGATGVTAGVLTGGQAVQIAVANDGGPGTIASPNLSYGTWALTVNNNSFLQLDPGGVGGATAITLAGKGNVALGQDVAGDWGKLTSINASTDTGNVVITGSASVFGNSLATNGNPLLVGLNATGANPNWLFGSAAGLLSGDAVFNSYTGTAASANTLDVSGLTLAQFAAGKFTGNTAAGIVNQLVVADAVATTTSATTFTPDTGWQQLDVTNISGTINYANLPTTVNDIFFMTALGIGVSAPVAITNAPGTLLTVDTEATLTAAATLAVTSAAAGASTASLAVVVGDATWAANGFVGTETTGAWTIKGESIVNISSVGSFGGSANFIGAVALTPALAEVVNFSGNTALTVGGIGTGGIFDLASTALMQITDTSSATLTFGSNALGFSTNAISVIDTGTGGLIMTGGDSNAVQSTALTAANNGALVLGVGAGDILTGSATGSNVIIGSTGSDTMSGGSGTDTFVTNGGPDAITLGATHAGPDAVGIYTALGTFNTATPGVTLPSGLADGITTAGTDDALAGYWGVGVGVVAGATTVINNAAGTGMYAPGTGTSTDMATVANFVAGAAHDFVVFGVEGWQVTAAAADHGLVDVNAPTTQPANSLGSAGLGTAAIFTNSVAVGGSTVTAPAGADVILLSTPELNANGVANSLAATGATPGLTLGTTLTAANDYHFLVAYQVTGTTNVRIADVDVFANVTSPVINATNDNIVASDMVQLTGVVLGTLVGANIHFITA